MSAAVLVSPSEPPILRSVGVSSSVPEQYGSDVLIGATWGLIGVQRKEFPGDFLASLHGDRFSRLVRLMAPLRVRVLVLEGRPQWTIDGHLVADQHRSMTREALYGLQMTALAVHGIGTLWTEDLAGTVALVGALARWAEKGRHDSLSSRPGPVKAWARATGTEWAEFLLQGIQGLGPEQCRRIVDHFGGRLPLQWSVTEAELLKVPGIGPGRLKRMTEHIPARPVPEEDAP